MGHFGPIWGFEPGSGSILDLSEGSDPDSGGILRGPSLFRGHFGPDCGVQVWFGGHFGPILRGSSLVLGAFLGPLGVRGPFGGNLGISSQFSEPLWWGFGSIQQGLRSILGDVYPGGLSTHSGEFL